LLVTRIGKNKEKTSEKRKLEGVTATEALGNVKREGPGLKKKGGN